MIPHSRPRISEADIAALADQLASGMLAEGEAAAKLERELARRYGFADAIAVGSGSQALLLALKAIGVVASDRVCVPTYVCPEILGVVNALGAIPVLADVKEDYLLDDRDSALSADVAAIVLPSLFGRRAALPIGSVRPPVVHDWAHYLPAAASFPDVRIAIVSFSATKVIAGGEGGAVLVADEEIGERVRACKRALATQFRLNLFPLSDLQAALVRSQLNHLDEMIVARQRIAAYYAREIGDTLDVWTLRPRPGDIAFRLPMRLSDDAVARGPRVLDDLLQAFDAEGVAARRPVAVMLHHLQDEDRKFPVAEKLFASTFSLPLYPALTETEQRRVIEVATGVLS